MNNDLIVSVRVFGEFACFTRPEHKVERVSYPIITPSAARGIMEAIYWHPQFTWRVIDIKVLSRGSSFNILRNEVNSKMSPSRTEPYFADEDRSQRNTLGLRDVDYIISGVPVLKPGTQDGPKKFTEQFQRRVDKGACFHRPALGCREFAAEFGPVEDVPNPFPWTEDLGIMLWDLDFRPKPPHIPLFFHAKVESGVMLVPAKPIGVE